MKNLIFPYEEFRDDVVNNDFYIEVAFFGGIKVVPKNNDLSMFVMFNCLQENGQFINVSFIMKFDNEEEYDNFTDIYQDVGLTQFSKSEKISALISFSCFYKEKSSEEDRYMTYCRLARKDKNHILKMSFSRLSYMTVMNTLNNIRLKEDVSINDIDIYNTVNINKVTKITSDYTVSLEMIYLPRSKKIFDNKIKSGMSVVTIYNDKHKYGLFVPIVGSKSDARYYNQEKLTANIDEINELTEDVYKDESFDGSYMLISSTPIEFSLSANSPMTYISLLVSCEAGYEFLDLNPVVYNNMMDLIFNKA